MKTTLQDDRRKNRDVITSSSNANGERRTAKRLEIHIPVECRLAATPVDKQCHTKDRTVLRTFARNISSGGMYLELDEPAFAPGDVLNVALTLPPGEGVSPYPGLARTQAEILRIDRIKDRDSKVADRYGIAAKFLDRLRFEY